MNLECIPQNLVPCYAEQAPFQGTLMPRVRRAGRAPGRYGDCAHSIGSLNFCHKYLELPAFVHDVNSYDGHTSIRNAEKFSNEKKTDVIAQKSEKNNSFGCDSFSVEGSFSFTPASLDRPGSLTRYDNTHENIKGNGVTRELVYALTS